MANLISGEIATDTSNLSTYNTVDLGIFWWVNFSRIDESLFSHFELVIFFFFFQYIFFRVQLLSIEL